MLRDKIKKLVNEIVEERNQLKMTINGAWGIVSISVSDEIDRKIVNMSWENFGKLEALDNVIKRLGSLVGKKPTVSNWDGNIIISRRKLVMRK